MTTASIETHQPQSHDLSYMLLGRGAPPLFLTAIVTLSVVAFMAPVQYAWNRPTYDDSIDDERAEVGARDGFLEKQLALGALGLFGAVALATPSDKRLRISDPLGLLCIAYLTWCVVSLVWSDDPMVSLRRGVALACEVAAGMAIAKWASPRQFVWFVFGCTLMWLGLGVVAEVTQGALQPWEESYRFKGIFHANVMSVNCALLIMSALYLSGVSPTGKNVLRAIAATAFVFLLLTGSRTALGAAIISFAAVSLITASPPKKHMIIGLVGLSIFGATLAGGLGLFDVSTDWLSMGRQDNEVSSLSGRVPLWSELLDYVFRRPLGGYGYGAYWMPDHIVAIARSQGWNPSYAHSVYIDLLLSIGFIGTFLFLAAMVLAFVRGARLETRYTKEGYGFIAMLIACILVDGVMETTFGSTWFMSFFGICAVCFLLINAPQPSSNCTTARTAR